MLGLLYNQRKTLLNMTHSQTRIVGVFEQPVFLQDEFDSFIKYIGFFLSF